MNTPTSSQRALLLALFTAAAFAARAQNVGVGTLTPTQKLDVVGGNVKISTAGSSLIFPDGTTQSTAASGTGTGSFILNAPASQQTGSFNLSGAGTLGGALTAGSTVVVDNADSNTGTAANFLRFGGSSSGEGIGSKRSTGGNAYALDFYTSFANRMTITNAGNVGIGTTTPVRPLDVNGQLLLRRRLILAPQDGSDPASNPIWNLDNYGSDLRIFQEDNLSGTGGAVRLTVKNGGNVGIGTSTPRGQLDVAGTGDIYLTANPAIGGTQSLSLPGLVYLAPYGSSSTGNSYIQAGVNTAGANQGIVFRTNNGGSYLDALMLTSAGRVGIGTGSPAVSLHSTGQIRSDVGLQFSDRSNTANNFEWYATGNRASLFAGVTGLNTLTVLTDGKVGIGTTGPAFPLDVQTTATTGAYSFGYLNPGGQTGSGSIGANGVGISIRATGRILSSEFNAVSDRRLKTVVGLSDRTADLALLNRLRITDYTMRDRVQFGNRAFKKVIAQEVEAIFPQAVQQQTGFLPDVYALATAVQALPGDSLVALTLPAGLPTAGTAGQRLKLVGEAGEVLAALARPAAAGARTLVLRRAQALAGTKVFVFGLEHADVRSVDYEALSMLNVSATQELARKVEALEKQNAALLTGSAADHASLLSLQAQMARLLGEGAQAQK
jgi:hypothetical protein